MRCRSFLVEQRACRPNGSNALAGRADPLCPRSVAAGVLEPRAYTSIHERRRPDRSISPLQAIALGIHVCTVDDPSFKRATVNYDLPSPELARLHFERALATCEQDPNDDEPELFVELITNGRIRDGFLMRRATLPLLSFIIVWDHRR